MCYLCLKDDIFVERRLSDAQLLRERAAHIKSMIREAEENKERMCYVGDAAVELLKKEQYEIAKKL